MVRRLTDDVESARLLADTPDLTDQQRRTILRSITKLTSEIEKLQGLRKGSPWAAVLPDPQSGVSALWRISIE